MHNDERFSVNYLYLSLVRNFDFMVFNKRFLLSFLLLSTFASSIGRDFFFLFAL